MFGQRTLMFALVLCLICNFTSGCVPKTPMPKVKAEYYPQCQRPFIELRDYRKEQQKKIAGYTAGGAAAGAAVGALTGLIAGNWRAALVGGIAGAITGAATGYSIAKVESIGDEQRRLISYSHMMNSELEEATEVEIAALRSLKCYIQEFEQLQKLHTAKQITTIEFNKRYSEIKAGITELGTLTSNSRVSLAKQDVELRNSLQKEINKKAENKNVTLITMEQAKKKRAEKRLVSHTRKPPQPKNHPVKKPDSVNQPVHHIEPSSSLALADLKTELDKLAEDAQEDKAKFKARKAELPPEQPAKKETPVASQKTQESQSQQQQQEAKEPTQSKIKTVTVAHVASAYDDYPNKVIQFEDFEQKRKQTLSIMDEAVNTTGIDAV